MAPIIHLTSDATPQGTGTELELFLITTSLTVTILVQVARTRLPGKARINSYFADNRLVVFVLHSLSVSLFIASLVLGWQRRITLEALVAVIFALAPTFARLSTVIIFVRRISLFLSDAYRKGSSLYALIDDDDLCYLRIETPCRTTTIDGDAHPVAKCGSNVCNARIYCVYRTHQRSSSCMGAIAATVRRNVFCFRRTKTVSILVPLHIQREGGYQRCLTTLKADVIDHRKHTIDIRPVTGDPRSQRFDSEQLLSTLSLADEPNKVFLETETQVFVVLSMIMEIFMIGELVYFVRDVYLNDELQSIVLHQKAQKWTLLRGRPMLVHKRIIERLQLLDWMPENFEHFTADGIRRNENQSRLFYILLEKSGVLYDQGVRHKHTHAIQIVKDIKDCELEDNEFEGFLYDKVDQWLESWGCKSNGLRKAKRSSLLWPVLSSTVQNTCLSA